MHHDTGMVSVGAPGASLTGLWREVGRLRHSDRDDTHRRPHHALDEKSCDCANTPAEETRSTSEHAKFQHSSASPPRPHTLHAAPSIALPHESFRVLLGRPVLLL